jgi:DNA invertase Pin-like site-specific DNA recombinase
MDIGIAESRSMWEYGARCGWTITMQVREVNSRAPRREAREKVKEAARRREIDLVLVWRLDRWGRSVTDCSPRCKNWSISASGSCR